MNNKKITYAKFTPEKLYKIMKTMREQKWLLSIKNIRKSKTTAHHHDNYQLQRLHH